MKTYKRIVTFCLGLCIILIFGALNALFMTPNTDWYQSLVLPKINLLSYEAGWLVVYISLAAVLSEFLSESYLRKRLYAPFTVLFLNVLFCAVFFRLYQPAVALGIAVAILADILYMIYLTVKKAPVTAFVLTFLACWYVYVVGLNIFIILLN